MWYKATFRDGSSEILEADSVSAAKDDAKSIYPDSPVRRVEVLDDDEDDYDDDEEDDQEDEC